MTAEELKEHLHNIPENAVVIVSRDERGTSPAEAVEYLVISNEVVIS